MLFRENSKYINILKSIFVLYFMLCLYPKEVLSQTIKAIPVDETLRKANFAIHVGNPDLLLNSYNKLKSFINEERSIPKEQKSRIISSLCTIPTTNISLSEKAGIDGNEVVSYCSSLLIEKDKISTSNNGVNEYNLYYQARIASAYSLAKDHISALSIAKDINLIANNNKKISSPVDLGFFYSNAGKYKEAAQYYKDLIDKNLENEIEIELSVKKNKFNKSEEEAFKEQYKEGRLFIKYRKNLGYNLAKSGEIDKAEAVLTKALRELEAVIESTEFFRRSHNYQAIPISGSKLVDQHQEIYRLLQEIKILKGKYEEAFEISERGRTLGLLFLTKFSDNPSKLFKINETKIEQLKQIAHTTDSTIIEYSVIDGGISDNSKLMIYLINAKGEFHFTQLDATILYSHKDDIYYAIALIAITSVCSLFLDKKNIKYVFLCFTIVAFIFLTSCNHILVPKLKPESCGIENNESSWGHYFNSAYKMISEYSDYVSTNDIKECLSDQYKILIQPIEKYLSRIDKRNLLIVPDSEIYKIPFAALRSHRDRYLIEDYVLQVSPSIQILPSLEKAARNRSTSEDTALVVGNPFLSKKLGNEFGDLPGTELEAKKVATLLNSKAIFGKDATETQILKSIAKAKFIHFATHGKLNYVDPDSILPYDSSPDSEEGQLFSGVDILTFAPSAQDDGILNEIDLYKYEYLADLVVLSACETGLGVLSSDGVIGLARPFLSQGVPTVIASLWKIPDAPTTDLMVYFYEYLQENIESKPFALQQAMLKMKGKYDDPRSWSGFISIGLPISPDREDYSTDKLKQSLNYETLKNSNYFKSSEGPEKGFVKLEDGSYQHKSNDRGRPETLNIYLSDTVAFGDLNNDGIEDAVVILAYNSGGSGSFMRLGVVLNINGIPKHVFNSPLGDRVRVNDIQILPDGKVRISFLSWPNDVRIEQIIQISSDSLKPYN